MKTTVINRVGAKPGDVVASSAKNANLLKGLALISLFPVIGFEVTETYNW